MTQPDSPDFRALCAELIEWLILSETPPWEVIDQARTALATPPPGPPSVMEALAARPLLEQVARLGDCIGANTVGKIMAISSRAAAWLKANPPGQPVAIEPRGCPTPGACSCVEPATPPPLAPDYIDPEHHGEDRELLQVFYAACNAEGGTADEIHLRGIRAVMAARAALVTPPPEPPTIMEILTLIDEIDEARLGQIDLVRAALERWGR